MSTTYSIAIAESDVNFPCTDTESVLAGMRRSGRDDIPVGCQGGGCGACRIRVLEGTYTKRRMSRAHVSEAQEAEGVALACRISPTSSLQISIASI